jgi:diaminopropionate ammonia-lyase
MNDAYSHCRNDRRLTSATEERAAECARNLGDWSGAVEEIHTWPEYAPQPLHVLGRTGRVLGISKLFYKDESQRFGRELGSFKALGAPYTVSSLLRDEVARVMGERPTIAELRTGRHRRITERVTVCVATDGNQGRGLAYGAREFGCRCGGFRRRRLHGKRRRMPDG